jgi:outer membrane protein assembly factor BamD (BamD/ComL family)
MKRLKLTLLSAIFLSTTVGFSTYNALAQQKPDKIETVSQNVNVSELFNEGLKLLEQKKFSEAAKIFERVIAINPRRPYAHTNLSWAYLELGRYDEAAAMARLEIEFKLRPNTVKKVR